MFVVLSGLITILLLTILPFLRDQTEALIASFPGYARQLGMDIDMWARNSPVEAQYMEISKNMQTNAEEFLGSLTQNFSDIAGQTLDSVTGLIATLTNFIVSLVTVPFILFYLLKDGTKLYNGFLHVLPPKMRGRTGAMLIEMDEQLRSYIQGQMLVSLCIGVMMYIGFLIIGLDYALLTCSDRQRHERRSLSRTGHRDHPSDHHCHRHITIYGTQARHRLDDRTAAGR